MFAKDNCTLRSSIVDSKSPYIIPYKLVMNTNPSTFDKIQIV